LGEGGVLEQLEIDEWGVPASLDEEEDGVRHDADRRQPEDGDAGPADLGAEEQDDHQAQGADDEQQQTDDVDGPLRPRLLHLVLGHAQDHHERDD
jgi:hypothetical protein